MWSKRFRDSLEAQLIRYLLFGLGLMLLAGALASAQDTAPAPTSPDTIQLPHSAPKIKTVDADHRTVVLNRPGMFCVVIGTNAASQDAAREAGKALYPFQGLRNFQLVVVVDLRGSIAAWAPELVEERMRASLDREAIELKPEFLKHGNLTNPRLSSHVVADFSGTIFPQLGWNDSSDDLRGIFYGPNGREIKRWQPLVEMDKFQAEIRAAMANPALTHRSATTSVPPQTPAQPDKDANSPP